MIFTAICRYLHITIEPAGLGYLSTCLSLIPLLSLSLCHLCHPPHATKTIEQTVIGQFEFMYTRRSHERFVGPSRLGLPQNTCTFTCACACNNTSCSLTAPTLTLTPAPVSVFSICVFILCLCCSVLFCSVGLWASPWPTVSNVACYGPQMLLSKAYP